MKRLCIIQARMGSTRLPGKVLARVLDKPLLSYSVDRLRLSQAIDHVVVATSILPADDAIEAFCRAADVDCFRGDEQDVLDRYFQCAKHQQLAPTDLVFRVTGDCPLIDPGIIDQLAEGFGSARPQATYGSNTMRRTYPRGLDCELFSFEALATAHREAVRPSEREHVTPFFYNQPGRFPIYSLENDHDHSEYRWTVDTAEDFELIRRLLLALVPQHGIAFSWKQVLKVMIDDPGLKMINSHIEQKR